MQNHKKKKHKKALDQMQKYKTLLTAVQVPGPPATTRALEFYTGPC